LGRGQNQWGAETGVPTLVNGSVQVTGSVVLPPPEESGIEHLVVVTMENRSFDHFLGWLAGADGLPPGHVYRSQRRFSSVPPSGVGFHRLPASFAGSLL
jgi:phospholipase C